MDASSRKILGLISENNVRFVVPVYQRPYSWGVEQCVQLWDDVLACGRRGVSHFTGSVVTIQDGRLSDGGVASLLVIDGQQRLTTITLLMIALARHAASHAGEGLSFSADEILLGGYLTNAFRDGDDHYKLELSKGDRAGLRSLVDGVSGKAEAEGVSGRLATNLEFFQRRLSSLMDPDSVWAGLRLLEVVSVSLTQGQDDPQVIFESMNATGKDLSTADLVRNFVLMSHPLDEQGGLYRTYWQPIERILRLDESDTRFDEFLGCYLSVAQAPQSFEGVDAYQAFKRHVLARGYSDGDRIKNFSLRLKRFAGYFARVVGVATDDAVPSEVDEALADVRALGQGRATPFLVALLDARDHQDLDERDLVSLVRLVESYLTRRAVVGLPASVHARFFLTMTARLLGVREEEGDVASAMRAMFLNAEGTERMPADEEFSFALRTRDCFHLGSSLQLLWRLERAGVAEVEPDPPERLEHVMPEEALSDEGWRFLLGARPEASFLSHEHRLGNLALSWQAFDAQEGSLDEKRLRLKAPGGAAPRTSEEILSAGEWTPDAIDARGERLARQALLAWPMPQADEAARAAYRPRVSHDALGEITFADLFSQGLVEMDDTLVSASPLYPGTATVTSRGSIMLRNGAMFDDPDVAYRSFLETQGTEDASASGWLGWRRGEGGPLLDDLRGSLI